MRYLRFFFLVVVSVVTISGCGRHAESSGKQLWATPLNEEVIQWFCAEDKIGSAPLRVRARLSSQDSSLHIWFWNTSDDSIVSIPRRPDRIVVTKIGQISPGWPSSWASGPVWSVKIFPGEGFYFLVDLPGELERADYQVELDYGTGFNIEKPVRASDGGVQVKSNDTERQSIKLSFSIASVWGRSVNCE